LDSINKIDTSIAELSHKINLHNKISEILSRNGFVGYIFDSALEEINREVNENIKEITVISRLSMYFTPDQVAKSTGTVSKSINYKIFDRNEEVSFSTLSGSEKQSLLIAVDAAVDTVLCRRLGVDINYKILDEQFGWVDSAHKESLIDFIKNKYSDKIVLIVDHGSELNAAIDKKIVVVKQNGMATISCQAVS
jgi:DNA repair exonuclease SbcCD ATPase subunit